MMENSHDKKSPLVHLNLGVQLDENGTVAGVMVRERPFISDLKLDAEPDNLPLLIAIGEVMGVAQPLTMSRISCIGRMAILWLDHNRWLVLPPPGRQLDAQEALLNAFGQDIHLLEHAGQLQARLTPAAVRYLLESQNTRDLYPDRGEQRITSATCLTDKGISILALHNDQEYDILARASCVELLWQWLRQQDPRTG